MILVLDALSDFSTDPGVSLFYYAAAMELEFFYTLAFLAEVLLLFAVYLGVNADTAALAVKT